MNKSKMRATEDIYIGVVLAYRKGDVVPESAIKNLKIEGKVAREGAKATKPDEPKTAEPKVS